MAYRHFSWLFLDVDEGFHTFISFLLWKCLASIDFKPFETIPVFIDRLLLCLTKTSSKPLQSKVVWYQHYNNTPTVHSQYVSRMSFSCSSSFLSKPDFTLSLMTHFLHDPLSSSQVIFFILHWMQSIFTLQSCNMLINEEPRLCLDDLNI